MPGIRSILWSHGWCLGSCCASSSEKTLPYWRNSGGMFRILGCSALARVVDTVVRATTGSYRGKACRDAFLGGTVDVTTGPVLRVIDIVGITTDLFVAILHCDTTMLFLGGDIVGITTDSLDCIISLYSP